MLIYLDRRRYLIRVKHYKQGPKAPLECRIRYIVRRQSKRIYNVYSISPIIIKETLLGPLL
jgi:hypothetical protein